LKSILSTTVVMAGEEAFLGIGTFASIFSTTVAA